MSNPKMKFKTKNKQKLVFDFKKNEIKVEGPNPQTFWAQVQSDGGVAVSNGQVLKLKTKGGDKHEFKFDKNGVLTEVKAPQAPTLLCTATDASGNVGTATATPALSPSSDDDDDKKASKNAAAQAVATSSIPDGFSLEQNYPNPFNPSTVISFQLPVSSEVNLSIYNSAGQLVRTLVSSELSAGRHSITWNATDDAGVRVASGLYLYTLKAGAVTIQRKLVLMK